MYKIAICGKANSGKNTVGTILSEELGLAQDTFTIAFADPIKKMARKMFPQIPKKHLFGPSKFRSEIVPGAFKNGNPLTIRQLLIDLGTEVGRSYSINVWLDAFDYKLEKVIQKNYQTVMVTDVRFRNEFNHLKMKNFIQIRVLRNLSTHINHSSETDQEEIKDNEFDYVVTNNGTIEDLKEKIKIIASELKV